MLDVFQLAHLEIDQIYCSRSDILTGPPQLQIFCFFEFNIILRFRLEQPEDRRYGLCRGEWGHRIGQGVSSGLPSFWRWYCTERICFYSAFPSFGHDSDCLIYKVATIIFIVPIIVTVLFLARHFVSACHADGARSWCGVSSTDCVASTPNGWCLPLLMIDPCPWFLMPAAAQLGLGMPIHLGSLRFLSNDLLGWCFQACLITCQSWRPLMPVISKGGCGLEGFCDMFRACLIFSGSYIFL